MHGFFDPVRIEIGPAIRNHAVNDELHDVAQRRAGDVEGQHQQHRHDRGVDGNPPDPPGDGQGGHDSTSHERCRPSQAVRRRTKDRYWKSEHRRMSGAPRPPAARRAGPLVNALPGGAMGEHATGRPTVTGPLAPSDGGVPILRRLPGPSVRCCEPAAGVSGAVGPCFVMPGLGPIGVRIGQGVRSWGILARVERWCPTPGVRQIGSA